MAAANVVVSVADIQINPRDLPVRARSRRVLMVDPAYFDVLYVINPHMEGNIGQVDKSLARTQWLNLKQTYERLGFDVDVMPGEPGLPDMVFTANQSFPYFNNGEPTVVISRMRSKHRQPEVEHFAAWYKARGYRVFRQADPPVHFEGMGDARWHPDRKLLYVGYGYRTDFTAVQRAATHFTCPVVGLELVDPRFYHLDTALSPLDEHTALYVHEAFTEEGVALLQRLFPTLIRVPIDEAAHGFAANGHCPDRKHFIVHRGNTQTNTVLRQQGFEVIEVDTSEFIKSGGSVFCMKMMLP